MEESDIWKILDVYFRENPNALVRHHIDSFDQFYTTDLAQILNEMNPIKLDVDYDNEIEDFRSRCLMYVGGINGDRIYFGKPIINDEKNNHYMLPNECRLREMTYSTTIHYDVEIVYKRKLRPNEPPTKTDKNGYAIDDQVDDSKVDEDSGKLLKENYTPSEMIDLQQNTNASMSGIEQEVKILLPKIYLGKFPIMLQSKLCILHNMPREMRFSLGECKNDNGGYFIIDGKEKVVVPQEAFGNNMLNIYKVKNDDSNYSYSAEIKSVSENISKPMRTLGVHIIKSTPKKHRENIGVIIPNAGNVPIPLFTVFKALGILTDKEIISYCTLLPAEQTPNLFITYFDACIQESAYITTQYEAVSYISKLVKGFSITRTMHILADYFLPHVGEVNYIEKAYHLGYIVNRLISVATGIEPETDRDSYKYKRLSLVGPMLKNLFREYYKQQKTHIRRFFEYRYEFGKEEYRDLSKIIYQKYTEAFQERIVETGFKKAFKGSWGASPHTKIVGAVQDANRLSHNGLISHLRKTNLPLDSSVKLVGPRVLHGSQWGIMDPIDTPDGGNIGLHKYLSILAFISNSFSSVQLIKWLKDNFNLVNINHTTPERIGQFTKIMVNGYWCGSTADPTSMIKEIKLYRRQGMIPITTSIMFDNQRNTIIIGCDGGRICRPIFFKDEFTNKFSFETKEWENIVNTLNSKGSSKLWEKLITGFHEKNKSFNMYDEHYFKWNDLYSISKDEIKNKKAVLEYLDTQETEGTLICMSKDMITENSSFTHCEIHPSTIYGVMCNLINYIEHNPASRNSFSCGQSKQACSLYSTNYQLRMDKSAVVLNNGQIPLVKSRYLEYINNEEMPYGENAIVAIMCFTGYNVEDAILINEAALQRGLFRTTYYNTYVGHEIKEIKNDTVTKETLITNINNGQYKGIKPDYDYSHLDENGIISENTEVNEDMVLIGMSSMLEDGERKDESKVPKKGQLGFVDKAIITEGDEGNRIAKVRIRHTRIPTFGDKFASRAGQKGTVGMVVPEKDMPFTKNGTRPDIIINPHALPSRMTIGQMVESIVGKACSMKGAFGDCTAFYNRENKIGLFGEVLTKFNFHSSGDEILYDGMSGKQVEASVFIGPTYYMRLKHMVKDKINHRATGPLTKLTRQPVSGRANDGGLRIGEMERDAVISHGMSSFLRESMMERADKFKFAICNKTGCIAAYNQDRDIMISPLADGPIKFTGQIGNENTQIVSQITKHGRSFSIVEVPYTLKLLMQELGAINVQMRLITDDNVEQFMNMKSSRNIQIALNDENADIKTLTNIIEENLKNKIDEQHNDPELPTDVEEELQIKFKQLSPNKLTPVDIENLIQKEQIKEKNQIGNKPKFTIKDLIKDSPPKQIDNLQLKHPSELNSISEPSSDQSSPQFQLFSDDNIPDDYEINLSPATSVDNAWTEHYSTKYNMPYWFNTITGESVWNKPNNFIGGGKRILDTYDIGQTVYYKGDPYPGRLWKITEIGNKILTIVTTDIKTPQDEHLKVVRQEDISLPSVFDYSVSNPSENNNDEMVEYTAADVPTTNGFVAAEPNNPPYAVNIAPVIKVIGHGNDMSQPTPEQPNIIETPNAPSSDLDPNIETLNFNEPLIVKKIDN